MSAIRVLVVDDDAEVRETLQDILELEGYAVTLAASGEEALVAFATRPFPVVLLDIRMPGIDGITTLERIKELDSATRVIMITGLENPNVVPDAMAKGAEAVFRKPLDIAFFLPLLLES
jgi:CheY-like chemotaxis protein